MGEGRDAAVAVLQMAADDRPCRCLGKVLRGLADNYAARFEKRYVDTVDEVVEVLGAAEGMPVLDDWRLAAQSIDLPAEWDAREPYVVAERWDNDAQRPVPTTPVTVHDGSIERDAADVLRAAALLPIVQSYAAEPLEPGDTIDLDTLVRHAISQRGLGWPPDVEDDEVNLAILLRAQAEAPISHTAWLDKATPVELARAVRAADVLEDIFRSPSAPSLPHEDRWRRVGLLAICVGPMVPLFRRLVSVIDHLGTPDGEPTQTDEFFTRLRMAISPTAIDPPDGGTGGVQSG
jgi:hypothetical protein